MTKTKVNKLSILRSLQNLLTLLSLSAFAHFCLAAPEDFPFPDNLKPAVNFWVRVYTEIDTNKGFLHDAENLSIVYTQIERDRKLINDTRNQLQQDLKVLSTGVRAGLNQNQQRLLAMWPEDVSNERLLRAADNIRWQLGQSDRFLAGLKRSGAYRKHIEEVIVEQGLPIELAVLPHVESSFHPGAYSSASATGMWQFVRSTAQRFMRVDYVVDERLDPYSATNAAMALLEFNYNALGTWPLALTAYNHGANGMARAVEETGSNDIGRIIAEYKGPLFRFASRNFYPQFLAVLEVEGRQEEFFGIVALDRYPAFAEVEIPAYIDAQTLAETLRVDFNQLRSSNPALQPAVWSGTKRIPKGYRLKLDQLNYSGDLSVALANFPQQSRFNEQIPDLSYVVRRGDSLSVIADRYDLSVSELVAINQLRNRNRIRIGQTLLLPQPDGSIPNIAIAGQTTATRAWSIPNDGKYQVIQGDTLSIIADRFRVQVDDLLALNSMGGSDLIFPGQSLWLKNDNSSADELDTGTELALEQQELNSALEEEPVVVLEQLPLDSNNLALEVSEQILAIEEQQQLQIDLSADPADYSVFSNDTIIIQAAETLGHYADWLGIKTSSLRRLNNLRYLDPVIIGQRLKLSFEDINKTEFETRRKAYHRDLQQEYFKEWRIRDTEAYAIKRNDLVVTLARRRQVPMWLFWQYNPDIDLNRTNIGQEVVFPIVEQVEL